MKCKTCVHYVFEKRIECCHSHGEIQIGRCNLTVIQTGRKYGCMTEAETQGCENHIEQTWKYERGDVLKYGKRAITIISVQPEYSPNAYRVMDNWQSEYSLSENALDECEIIIKGVGAEL